MLIVLSISCPKEKLTDVASFKDKLLAQQRGGLPSVVSILDLLDDPVNGYISVTSYGTYAGQDLRDEGVKTEAILMDENGYSKDFGTVSLDTLTLSFVATLFSGGESKYGGTLGKEGSAELYGDTISVDVAGNIIGTDTFPGLSTSFYSPPMIELNSPAFQNNDTLTVSDLDIEWEDDPLNENGIAILIHYDAADPDNIDISSSDSDFIAIHTDDDGAYTFSSGQLSFIPDNGRVYLYIARGNYIREEMDDPDYAVGIYNYSVLAYKFTFDK